MLLLNEVQVRSISGGIYINYDSDHWSSNKKIEGNPFTIQFDGSLPPEFKARINAGESFESMKNDMRDYLMIVEVLKTFHPEMFVGGSK